MEQLKHPGRGSTFWARPRGGSGFSRGCAKAGPTWRCAGEERSAPSDPQIVSEVLDKRVIDRGSTTRTLQLVRLMPALRIVGEAIRRRRAQGRSRSIDRLDKHQTTVVAKYTYGPESGSVCLDTINRIAPTISAARR